MSEQVLNCPFCGSKPDVDTKYVGRVESEPYTAVMCLTSGCPSSYYHVALASWNRRATPPLPDDVAGLIDAKRAVERIWWALDHFYRGYPSHDTHAEMEAEYRKLLAALESQSRERAVLVGLMKDVQAALLGADGPNGFGLWALPIEIEERLRLALIGSS